LEDDQFVTKLPSPVAHYATPALPDQQTAFMNSVQQSA
jgi:hypothetical protein